MVQGVVVENGVIQNINPATGQLIEPAVSVTSPEEIETIVSVANASQPSWSDKTLSERIEAIRKGLIAVEPIADELASVITKEMGKISAEAKLEVSNAIGLKGAWLDMVKEANEDVHLGGGEEGKAESVVVRDPLGVVVVISPWNVSMQASAPRCTTNHLFVSVPTNIISFKITECLVPCRRNSFPCHSSSSGRQCSNCQALRGYSAFWSTILPGISVISTRGSVTGRARRWKDWRAIDLK